MNFTWGAGTSAYQIEGGVDRDGRVPSIWDTFCARPGAVADGTSGAVAADHRARFREDVALLASLGLPAYRFSVSWPRVLGSGLDFYSELVDALLEAGVEPFLTLYHWDLPQSLEDEGGWPVRATAERFAEYASSVVAVLGDRVRHWGTINEPWCASMLGYAAGVHAPGRTEPGAAVAAAHHLLLAHGLALEVLPPGASTSITLNPYPVVGDADAVRRVDGIANRLWYDPLLRGSYPDDVLEDVSSVSDLSWLQDGDLDIISRPISALGLNYYRRHHVRVSPGASAVSPWPGSPDVLAVEPPGEHTDGGWAIEPDGLYEVLVRVTADYPSCPPLYVHENGAAFREPVDDRRRVEFLASHVDACRRAIADGVDLRGYFAWSLLDNFEWAEGYRHRFGLVHVDYETQVRTPKASARWFSELVGRSASDPLLTRPGDPARSGDNRQ